MKIITIIGARPQFVKAAVLSRCLKSYKDIKEIIIHTGQHYDQNMSKIFFDELQIPYPDYNLEVGSGTHAFQTGMMMIRLEEILIKEKPDWIIVYGDTNSTVAAGLVSAKLHIKMAHIEAGLRSFNKKMPEEINRIVTDHVSQLLFVPTNTAMELLKKEGLKNKSIYVGDIMYESVLFYQKLLNTHKCNIKLPPKFYLATIHRPQNTDNETNLLNILSAFSELAYPVILPLHPRTKKIIKNLSPDIKNTIMIEPVGYLDLLFMLNKCEKVLTDSGGLQKEAYFMKKQCLTLRTETEWTETLENNWNYIVGANKNRILKYINKPETKNYINYFGDGNTAKLIIESILNYTRRDYD